MIMGMTFTVYGVFQCLNAASKDKMVYLNKNKTPISVNRIERYSLSSMTTTGGSS